MTRNYYQRKIVGLYLIQHLETLRCYVGQSRDVVSRWAAHCSGGKKAVGVAAAIRDEGVDSFLFSVLEECSVSQLNEREVWWIQHYNCVEPHGYNRNSGGGAPTFVSAETCQKLSAAAKARAPASAETRQKNSEAQKARAPASDETLQKMSEASKGRKHSAESRHRISESQKGKTHSAESRHRISEASKGRKHSAETRQKLSAAAQRREEMRRLRGAPARSPTDHREKGQEPPEPLQPPATTSEASLTSEGNPEGTAAGQRNL